MNSCWSGCSVIAMSMTTHLAFTLSRPPRNLKAALAVRALDYPRTHNLGALVELLSKAGVILPEGLADIDRLTPFGTVFRYDEVLPQAGQDRSQ